MLTTPRVRHGCMGNREKECGFARFLKYWVMGVREWLTVC